MRDKILDLVMRDWNALTSVESSYYDNLNDMSSDNSDDEDFTFQWVGSSTYTPAKRSDVASSPNT